MNTVIGASFGMATRRVFGTIALLIALFIAVGPPAGAAPNGDSPAVGHPIAVKPVPGQAKAGDFSTAAGCPVTFYGFTGAEICGYDHTGLDWGGGNIEWFVVGTDYAIWHIWKNSGGWHSLGGQASRNAPNGAYTYANGVSTWGTDEFLWCRDWPWSAGWHRC